MAKAKVTPTLLRKFMAIFLVAALIAWTVPIPSTQPQLNLPKSPISTAAPVIAWPTSGQAALGVYDYGILDTHGTQQSSPTASVAKVFTALAVLRQKPLAANQAGPNIVITQADMDSYNSYYTQGGSLVPVALGEHLSERQALEGMLLPSANNMADTLARWAFGSMDNYISAANKFNAQLGLKQTHIADASGFSAETVSSAEDLVKIGQVALSNQVLKSIVNEQQADVPVAGTIHNTNWLIGVDGINGIKTGNTEAAGGCYLFSADRIINGKVVPIIGAIMSSPSLTQAMTDSRSLLNSVDSGFSRNQLLAKGQDVGEYVMPWGKRIPIKAAADVSILGWYKKSAALNYSAIEAKRLNADQTVGYYYVNSGVDNTSINLVSGAASGHAPWRWRLYQRFF